MPFSFSAGARQAEGMTTATMRAISQDVLGGTEVLKEVELDRPEPGLSEILVRVHAAGVNPTDWKHRAHSIFLGPPPFVLGWDVSGVVAAEAARLGIRAEGILVEADHAGMTAIADLVTGGKLRPVIAGTFPPADAAMAHELGGDRARRRKAGPRPTGMSLTPRKRSGVAAPIQYRR